MLDLSKVLEVSQKGPMFEVLRTMQHVVLFIYTVTLVLICFGHSVTIYIVLRERFRKSSFLKKDYIPLQYSQFPCQCCDGIQYKYKTPSVDGGRRQFLKE